MTIPVVEPTTPAPVTTLQAETVIEEHADRAEDPNPLPTEHADNSEPLLVTFEFSFAHLFDASHFLSSLLFDVMAKGTSSVMEEVEAVRE